MASVELIYLKPDLQFYEVIEAELPLTVESVILKSSLLKQCKELSLDEITIGIFSKKVSLETEVQDQDRIEVYRDLTIDPKEARRLRSAKS